MITNPTVIILGAGTSIPYGYPSGTGLVKDVVQNIESLDWITIIDALGINRSGLNLLRSELLLSQTPSMDAFLKHRPELLEAGKVAIALSLLSRENPEVFNDLEVSDEGIYPYLFNSLTASWEVFNQNKLTIITFNYDRSLEYFLFSALKHLFNKSDSDIEKAVLCLPIIHVHGTIGPLPWQAPDGTDYCPLFGAGIPAIEMGRRIKVASKNIAIVFQAQPKSKEFTFACECLKEAKKIYFLGFGYNSDNLEMLGLSQLDIYDPLLRPKTSNSELKLYRGSAFGLENAQIREIQNKWHIALPDNKRIALEFLREFTDLS